MVLAPFPAEIGAMQPFTIVSSLLALAFLNPAASQIRVRLYDYAGASPDTLARSKAAAGEVLAAAGVELFWLDCPSSACGLPVTPSDLQLRIVTEEMARRVAVTKTCLGYAVLAGEFSSIASVFFHRALELEKGNLADRSAILGAMMAHEIGHLLLSRNSHPETGIMRGIWGDQELKAIAKGRMRFTAAEAGILVTVAARRTGAAIAARK
jgi:hypothetical protein